MCFLCKLWASLTLQDGTPDELFYLIPRIGVYHVDDAFRAQLRQLYKVLIPAGGQVLDLCSQHDSHLPTDVNYELTVHGMNQLELLANTRAASRFTRNFNNDPTLPEFEDDMFDAVLMAVSIQYMQNPVRLISEVRRVLRPGGTFIVSFSNRMFFTKAVEVWRSQKTMRGLADLVMGYFSEAGFTDVQAANRVRGVSDTDWLRVGLSRLVPFFSILFGRQPDCARHPVIQESKMYLISPLKIHVTSRRWKLCKSSCRSENTTVSPRKPSERHFTFTLQLEIQLEL